MPRASKKSTNIFEGISRTLGDPKYGRRQFKRDLKKLQKRGLISKKVDVATQETTRYMLSTIRKFSDVLTGKAQVLSVPKAEKNQYKESGHRTKGNRVVIETPRGEKVKRLPPTKEGVAQYEVSQKTPTGIRKSRRILVPETDLERYITFLVEDAPELEPGEYYGIRFYGNNVARFFGGESAKQKLMEYMLAYADTKHNTNINYDLNNEGDETYKNFEVVTFESKQEWEQGIIEQRKTAREANRERNRQRYNEWQQRRLAAMNEIEREYYKRKKRGSLEDQRERQRKHRAKVASENPEKILSDREKAREGMRALRAKRKAERSK